MNFNIKKYKLMKIEKCQEFPNQFKQVINQFIEKY